MMSPRTPPISISRVFAGGPGKGGKKAQFDIVARQTSEFDVGKIVFSPGAALHLIRRTRPGLRDAEQLEVMARYMKSHRFFAQFPHSRLTKFAKVLHHVKIPSGQALCHQGDDSDGFYVLLSGVVTVHILTGGIASSRTTT